MRVRRRVALCVVVALVVPLLASAHLSQDARARRVVAAGSTSTSVDGIARGLDLAPEGPVSSDGDAGGVAAAATTPAVSSAVASYAEAVIQAAPQHFEGAAPKAVAPPAAIADSSVASQGTRQAGTWAVVVGINDYPGTANDLSSAVNDANDMDTALNMFGVDSDHILTLEDGQATASTVLNAISWLAAHASTDAVAEFFYAGHSRQTVGGGDELVLSDGSSITDVQLASALSHVVASRSWVAIAACFAGGFNEVLRPGRVLTAAADANSLAYENSAIGRSYMVEYMVREAMIQQRAGATVQSAFNYAVSALSQQHPGREPIEFDNGNGALDLRPPTAAPYVPPVQAPVTTPTTEPPASDRPPVGGQHCSGGLFRVCTNG